MLNSFHSASVCSDLIVDDTPGTTTSIINRIFNENPNYEWYHIANDDFIYHTYGWDEILQSDGVAYANDGFLKEGLCTISLINGNWARAVGWLQLPSVDFLYGDNVWMTIAKNLGKAYYRNEVNIQHKHMIKEIFDTHENIVKDLSVEDAVYHKTNSKEQYAKDSTAFGIWCAYQAHKDIMKCATVSK